MNFQGNEIFEVQGIANEKLAGILGLSQRDKSVIGVALDAAVIFGTLADRHGTSQPQMSSDAMMALLVDKIERLRHM